MGIKNTGGNAFPVDISIPGMTLRDYFAGQVIPSLIPDPQMSIKIQVEDAYRIADAMIKERSN